MSRLEDTELQAELGRRAGVPHDAAAISDDIRTRVTAARQVRSRAWDPGWAPRLSPIGGAPLTAAAAVGLIAVLAGASVIGRHPAASGGPTQETAWLLDLDQLERVVDRGAVDGADVGKVIVATVNVSAGGPTMACPHPASCPATYVVAGSNPVIRVLGDSFAVPCPTADACHIGTLRGPMALRIGTNHAVEYLGPVHVRPESPGTPWSVEEFRSQRADDARVVDGWLVDDGGVYFCPFQRPGPSGRIDERYGCGSGSWITPDPVQPTEVTQSSGGTNVFTSTPTNGIRVENEAYDQFAPSPTRSGTYPLPEPRRGLYLVAPVVLADGCWQCPSGTVTGSVVARIDPIDVPSEAPVASETPRATTAPTASLATDASPLLTQNELTAAVRVAASTGVGIGRTVVTNAAFSLNPACPSIPPSCVGIAGSGPVIRLLDPPQKACSGNRPCYGWPAVDVPAGRLFAVRIRGDGDVEWVDWVAAQSDGRLLWSFDQFKDRLSGHSPTELDAYQLYVVTGWVSSIPAIFDCATPAPGVDDRFGCGGGFPTFLTGSAPDQNGERVKAPQGSIRLQNGANAVAEGNAGSIVGQAGVFLVRPVVPAPGRCTMCDSALVAELIARLDAPSDASLSPSATPGASLGAEAAYALAYAEKFEDSRANGDWQEAWRLLGPAAKALYGSIGAFEQAEAAYNEAGANTYAISDPTRDPALLNEADIGAAWSDFVPSTAWYVSVNHPDVQAASLAFEGLVVASGVDGNSHVWIVH